MFYLKILTKICCRRKKTMEKINSMETVTSKSQNKLYSSITGIQQKHPETKKSIVVLEDEEIEEFEVTQAAKNTAKQTEPLTLKQLIPGALWKGDQIDRPEEK